MQDRQDRQDTLSAAPPPLERDDSPIRVLVVDDEASVRRSLTRVLLAKGFRVGTADGCATALDYVATNDPDVALVDLNMPLTNGIEVLRRIKATHPAVSVIIMTASADIDTAVAAMRVGAYTFLTKPFATIEAVVLAVEKAAEHGRLMDHATLLARRLEAHERFGELIGTSVRMQDVYRLIQGVAATTSTVLILGESGTGKELVARAIHQRSGRASAPIVAVNCAAIPRELVESELFGHERGAFTGANTSRAGLFETAHRGTIFLDEVGDLPLSAQVKLLRTLQEGEIKRVGSDQTRIVDVRVLAATNESLTTKMANGTFRRDLFYRLNVIPIELPPLRLRGDDTLVLAHHFIQKFAVRMSRQTKPLSADALQALRDFSWPGNVRELEHAIEHAFILSRGKAIEARDLPFYAAMIKSPHAVPAAEEVDSPIESRTFARELFDFPYAEAKRRSAALFDELYVREVIRRCAGNLSEAARQAGLDRSNFRRIVRKLNTT